MIYKWIALLFKVIFAPFCFDFVSTSLSFRHWQNVSSDWNGSYGVGCILQLAMEFVDKFPDTCKIIESFMWMIFYTGSDSASNFSRLCREIYDILQSVCFRKWISNNSRIIRGLSSSSTESNFLQLEENSKILRLLWCCYSDLTKLFPYSTS